MSSESSEKSQRTNGQKGAEMKIDVTKLDNKNDSLPNLSISSKKQPKRSLTEKLAQEEL